MPYKRRYLTRHYHPAFGYYMGFDLSTKATSQKVENHAPAIYGRPELCQTRTIPALPVAWDATDAKKFYEQEREFAYLTVGEKGRVIAGWVETADYERDKELDWHWGGVIDLKAYLKAGEPAYWYGPLTKAQPA